MMLGREVKLPPLWEFGDITPADSIPTNYVTQVQDQLANTHSDYRNLREQTTHFDIGTHKPYSSKPMGLAEGAKAIWRSVP